MVIWVCEAVQLIQIFCAHGRTDEGDPRGPRGPKKLESTNSEFVVASINFSSDLATQWPNLKLILVASPGG